MHHEVIQGDFLISTDKAILNVQLIHNYLSIESYWSKNIPLPIVQKSIEGSVCFGLYYQQQQNGFARVVTDGAIFGYIADVFIVKEFRGKGLSKWMMKTILSHPELQGFRRWMLGTKDAHGLYRQFGFQSLDEIYMILRLFNECPAI